MTTAFRACPPVLILLALSVMVLPTWRTTWLGPTVDSVNFLEFRWFAPIILGYGNPFPLLCVGCTVVGLALAVARLASGAGGHSGRRGADDRSGAGGGRGVALEVVLGVALTAAVLGGIIFDGLHGWAVAVPGLLLLSLAVLVLARLVARVENKQSVLAPSELVRDELSPGTDPGPTRGS